MNEIEKIILNEYAKNYYAESVSYEAMGRMLDEKYVEERLKMFDIIDVYIYGGTYIAVQLYRIGKKYTNIKAIVDKSGKVIMNENVPVLTLEDLKNVYNGEKIVVTLAQYFPQIRTDLKEFVEDKNIIGIGELLMGIA